MASNDKPLKIHEAVKCSVSWCPKPARANGYCRQHYRRFKRSGHPVALSGDTTSLMAVATEAVALLGTQAEKVHKTSKHTSAFASCSSGLCSDYHRMQALIQGGE